MTGWLNLVVQEATEMPAHPDLGIRISVWFIGMFLLSVGGALLYLRMKELQEERKSGDQG